MTFERLSNLNGKVVVITGGCGQVGYATAKRLSQQGARIICITHRNIERAQKMMNELPNSHLNHLSLLASVIDTDSLKKSVEEVKKLAGRCDILVNSAEKIKAKDYYIIQTTERNVDKFLRKIER